MDGDYLPIWVRVAADDAYRNGRRPLTPYSGRYLLQQKCTFNFYLSSSRMTVEQAFTILVARVGVFWSPLKFFLFKNTLIVMVACNLHNFTIDSNEEGFCNTLPAWEENHVE